MITSYDKSKTFLQNTTFLAWFCAFMWALNYLITK
jgi:hypothetical protein